MSDSVFDVINRRFVSGNSVCVERVHLTQSEWQEITTLRQQLADSEARVAHLESQMKAIKTAAGYRWMNGISDHKLLADIEQMATHPTGYGQAGAGGDQ